MRHNRDILPDDTMAYDKRRNSTDWWLTRAVDHPPNTFTMVVPFATTSAWRWWIKPPTKEITVEPYAPKDRNKKVKIKIWALFECAWRGMMNCDCKLSSNQMVVVADYVPIHKFISLSLKKVKYNIPFWNVPSVISGAKQIVRRPYPIPEISTTLQKLESFTYAMALNLSMG